MDKRTQQQLLEIVKRNYQEIALPYNETRKKRLEPLWSELVKIGNEVCNGQSVLDAGCGSGRLLEIFHGKKIKYFGIDANEELITLARRNYPETKFVACDLLGLERIPETNFDYVFAVAVLHHIPGNDLRIEALRQLKNKTNDNGKIIITVWNFWNHVKYCRLIIKYALQKMIKKHKMDFGDILFDWKNSRGEAVSQRYYHAFTKRGLRQLAVKAGLNIEKSYSDGYNYYLILKK